MKKSKDWLTPRKDEHGNYITNMEDNNKFWLRKGIQLEEDTWFSLEECTPGEHLVQEELVEVKGVCVWDSDGFMNTFCDFKVTHWRPLRDKK